MHADYLNVTVPDYRSFEVRKGLVDRLGLLGALPDTPDLYRLNGGTMKLSDRRGFLGIGLSGGMLTALRENNQLSQFLHVIGSVPHRVTRLDVANDRLQESPPILKALYKRAKAGEIALTRKRIHPSRVKFIESYDYSQPGRVTGSLYLGARTAEVRSLSYDKRNERISKGFPDPGPWHRDELTVTAKLSPSLRDVLEPETMYWHFMSDVVPPPANTYPWEGQGEGFQMDPPDEIDPLEVMRRKLEFSTDVDQLLELADRIGPNGYTALLTMLERKRHRIVNPSESDEAA